MHYRVQAVEGGPGTDGLLDDWDALHLATARTSTFSSAAWFAAHCRSYGTDGVLTVAVRRGDALVAVAGLRSGRRAGATVLTSTPSGVSDFTDVVLGDGDAVPRALVDALLAVPGWDVLEFPEVRPSAELWRLLPAWPGRSFQLAASECVVLDGHSVEEYAAGLPRLKRKQLGQQQRRIARAGVTARRREADADVAVRTLLDLHCRSWDGRQINPEHASARFEQLLVDAVAQLAARRQAFITEFLQSGRVCGSALYFAAGQEVGVYLAGHAPELRDQVSLHVLDTTAGFALVSELGASRLNLLRGAEDYKLRFPARRERNTRVLLARPGSVRGQALCAGLVGRQVARAVRGGRLRAAGSPAP